MPVECVNHPGIAARGKCSECGSALCDACKLTFKNRPVCDHCLEDIRHKMATDANAVFDTPKPETIIPDIASQTATRSVDVVLEARESLQEANRPSESRKLVQGAVIALIIGVILSLLVAQFRFNTNAPLAFMHVIVGIAVGYGMVVGARGGGKEPSVVAAIIAAFSLVSGIYFLLDKQFESSIPVGSDTTGMLSLSQFADRVGNYPYDWIFVFFGVIAAFLVARTNSDTVL